MSDHKMDAARYAFFKPHKVVGYWLLPGSVEGAGTTMIGCYKKPRWLTIKLMDWLLEFKYKESL